MVIGFFFAESQCPQMLAHFIYYIENYFYEKEFQNSPSTHKKISLHFGGNGQFNSGLVYIKINLITQKKTPLFGFWESQKPIKLTI